MKYVDTDSIMKANVQDDWLDSVIENLEWDDLPTYNEFAMIIYKIILSENLCTVNMYPYNFKERYTNYVKRYLNHKYGRRYNKK